jgi:hypothetical protein
MVLAAFHTATAVLTRARCVLDRGARSLLEKESLGEADLAQLKEELTEQLRGSSGEVVVYGAIRAGA